MQNYSRIKKYASGNKWGKPVIVPEHEQAHDNSAMVMAAMIVISILLIAGIKYYMMLH